MKKIIFVFVGLILMINVASAQIDDRAVIPVSVTLNSILRLNIVSGGNVEFNFNTLADYTNGISNNDRYDTRFTVASSVDWEVNVYTEDASFIGTDDATGANTMPLDNVGYHVTYEGSGVAANFNIPNDDPAAPVALAVGPVVLVGNATTNAGDVNQNEFLINWECGTSNGSMNAASILEQSLAADRYTTSVFLVLSPE